MEKLIRNDWRRESGQILEKARILSHEVHPEGLDVERVRFPEAGILTLRPGAGRIISILYGRARLELAGNGKSMQLGPGVHMYLPAEIEGALAAESATELLCVTSPSDSQARGKRLIIRDEEFLAACSCGSQSLRWILTPQYLSRRIFLHHDNTLLSKSRNPVSWFHTTMFDVMGLPENEDGQPVFKMSYNSRTEFNVCYDVKGTARVRMAQHPYRVTRQPWGPWYTLDGQSTYHLNEAAGSSEEECHIDEKTNSRQFFRNKHEVYIIDGHVSLFCMFDPAPTGIERHWPGQYSDYDPLSSVLGTEDYKVHQREIARYDEMVDTLSLAKATGSLDMCHGTNCWSLYGQGRQAQAAIEACLANSLVAEGKGREQVLACWVKPLAGNEQ